MTVRYGANGMPITKKVETIDEIKKVKKTKSKQMIQEILEENPNEGTLVDELDDFDKEEEDGHEEL